MKRISLERFSLVVAAIHEAAAAPELWPASLAAMMDLLQASKGALFDMDGGRFSGVTALNHAPEAQRAYLEHYFAVDPTMDACLALPANQPATVYEQFPRAVRSRGEYFAFAAAQDIGDVLGVCTRTEHGRRCILSLQRSLKASEFDDDAKRLMALLTPHLEIAKRVQRQLGQAAAARDALAAGLDRFAHPAFIVDKDGTICQMNAAAHRLLSKDARVRGAGGKLAFAEPQLRNALQAAVVEATGTAPKARFLVLPPCAGKGSAEVVVSPLRPDQLLRDRQLPLALVVIAQPRHDLGTIALRMRQLYGLTRAEGRVVALLAMGRSLQEIALANAVAEATLRSQLRSIRAKTGKRRQAEIVGLALAGVSLDLDPVSD